MRPLLFLAFLSPLPALAEAPKVVTDIAPVHSLVTQVMAGVGDPMLLVDGASDPHAVQLRPGQAKALAEADLVVWTGVEMTPWLDRALDGLSEGHRLTLLDLPETHLRAFAEGEHEEHDDHGEDADHDAHDEHDEHDHTGVDPHAFLNPENAVVWLTAIAAELGELDPENAAAYAANAEAAAAEVTQLDADMTAKLAPFADQEIVVYHDAFGYFADHYDIAIAGSIKPGDAAAPSAAALSEMRELVAEHGVTCFFGEPQSDPRLLDVVAAETGAKTGVLDPSGSALTPGAALYGDLIRGTADAIAECLAR